MDVAKSKANLLGDDKVDMAKAIVGKWTNSTRNETFIFTNKSVSITNTQNGNVIDVGIWKVEKNKIIVIWNTFGQDVITLSSDQSKISSETHNWVSTRVKN